ncbi:MAG: sensor histidine kinase [Actinomycetes bacterium]
MRRAWVPLVCVVLQLVSLGTGRHEADVATWAAVLFDAVAVASGLALLGRERFPLQVLTVTVVGYVAQGVLVGPVVPAALAVMTYVLARGPAPRSAAAGVGVALAAVAGVTVATGQPTLAAPYGLVLVVAAAWGLFVAARETRLEAARRELLAEQRLRIARDLHDIVGHRVGAITVQAGAARMAVASGASSDATRALLDIEAAGRSLMREVRWLVGLLRDESERPALADVPALVSNARRSGVQVDLSVDGPLELVPQAAGESAYRILQEALTNVLRHAETPTAQVSIAVADAVTLRVVGGTLTDRDAAEEGNGILGMRERAAAVGGTVFVGTENGSSWTVRAQLPIGGGR